MLFLDRVQAADAGADERAHFVAVDLLQIEVRIQQRLMRGDDGELGEAIGPPHFLGRRKCRRGIEVRRLPPRYWQAKSETSNEVIW